MAAVDAARAHGGFDGEVEIGGRHDDEGVAAAEFEDGFLDEPAGLGGDGAAGGLAAGDGDCGDALVAKDGLDLADFKQQRLKGAAGKAGATNQRLDRESALRDVRRMLEQADVACHQRGREKAEDLPEGEVPRHDGEHDAERIPAHIAVVGLGVGWLRAQGCGRRDRRSSGRRRRTSGSRASGFERLAHLERDQRGKVFGLVFKDGGELAHAEGAMLERHVCVGAEGIVGEGDLLTRGSSVRGSKLRSSLSVAGLMDSMAMPACALL